MLKRFIYVGKRFNFNGCSFVNFILLTDTAIDTELAIRKGDHFITVE